MYWSRYRTHKYCNQNSSSSSTKEGLPIVSSKEYSGTGTGVVVAILYESYVHICAFSRIEAWFTDLSPTNKQTSGDMHAVLFAKSWTE